jgi:hypothetical protein
MNHGVHLGCIPNQTLQNGDKIEFRSLEPCIKVNINRMNRKPPAEKIQEQVRQTLHQLYPSSKQQGEKGNAATIRGWRMYLKPDKTLEDLSRMFKPVIRGWVNYYGRFYKSELYSVIVHMNRALVRWAQRKYKKFARHQRRATHWLGKIARRDQKLFIHWQMGIRPAAG